MDLKLFVDMFAELFEETEKSKFKPSTKFRDIDEWSSFIGLSVIAMVDEKFNVKMTGGDIRESITIEDLFNIVLRKQ
jgi:acyl carrier protein